MSFSPRSITGGEETFLRTVFNDTLPYNTLQLAPNIGDVGGANNSITPGPLPFLATPLWCADFSDPSVAATAKGVLIHECVHVWQFYHGITKLSAIWLALRHLGDYRLAYPYDLSDEDDLTDFNIEQQAAIIQDWWRMGHGLSLLNNTGKLRSSAAYQPFVDQLRGAGLPHTPAIPPIPRYRR